MVTFNNLFEVSAEKFKDNVAIIKFNHDSFETYTYKDLQEATQILYEKFYKIFKIGDIIGLYCTHNVLIPVLINLIHKCGCSFVFFDTNADKVTIKKILKDMNINQIFAIDKFIDINEYSTTNLSELVKKFNCQANFYSKTLNEKDVKEHAENNVGYLIKTSGSTGIAKYVLVSHDSIYPNVLDFENWFQMSSKDIVYFSTPLTFDPSVIEIYLSVKCGSSLLIAPPCLKTLFQGKYRISVWQTTPSLFIRFGTKEIENTILSRNSSLRILALGGEPLYFNCHKLKSYGNQTRIYSLYGITEMSCWALVKEICSSNNEENNHFDLGNVLNETFVEIRDKNNKRVLNEMGNIFIGSKTRICLVGLENFINAKIFTSICNENIYWYDSGDLGTEKNGIIYFNGRQDRLIKRFGRKINLLEIEQAVLNHERVQQCICIWKMENQFLVAFYTSNENITNDLWKFIRKKLNLYSLPDHLIRVDVLPINDHGKISLSKSEDLFSTYFLNINSNANAVSVFISLISKHFLNGENLNNITDRSFIDIGGTSIQIVQLMNEFEKTSNLSIPDLYVKLLDKECSINSIIELLREKVEIKYKNVKNNKEFPINNMKRNMKFENKNLTKRPRYISMQFETIWKFNTGKCVDARPTLCKDSKDNKTFVLIGSHSGIVAILDAKSGDPHFSMNLNSRVEAAFHNFESNSDLNAVVGCYDGSFWCFSIRQKKVVWKTMLNSMIKSQACHIDSYIFVGTYDGLVYMIDMNTGKSLQSIEISNKGIAADLLCHGKMIFVGTLNGICACAIYSNGGLTIVWKNALKSPIFAKPSLLKNDSYVVFSEVDKKIHCFCTKSGDSIWIFDNIQGNLFSSCSVFATNKQESIIFGCHDQHTYKLSCKTPKKPTLDWRVQHLSEIYATPLVRDDSSIISISTDGHLQVISEDGEVLGQHRFAGKVFSSPITDDNLTYVGCRDDNIYCIKMYNNKK